MLKIIQWVIKPLSLSHTHTHNPENFSQENLKKKTNKDKEEKRKCHD